ncbi:MAG: hypothetical protein GX941_08145 [Candidatus Methanofastidiosa archaeon]|nr:hypothetical protein [Candidatus Methanofastidiosa archaeon]HOM96468.1 carboxypeptidase regulatory-like domain-containing protein [Methanofastidiosum sp.]HPC80512.1 carboxypeptidase regulatory-like domain-containing protein [Methanofastidiosum sp.]HRS25239.1 carboxypeptidase regulatory-like domain-containing protein [Methanofastidiosum sp.]
MLGRYSRSAIISLLILVLIIPITSGATNKNFLINTASVNGTQIPDVEVRLSLQSDTNYQRSGNTNSRGELLFENIAEGVYSVTISKAGFVTIIENVDISLLNTKTFYLRHTGFKVISGNVYKDSNNNNIFEAGEQGISNATVKVTNVTTNETYSVNTDENGQYRIEVPDAQNYKVKASYSTSEYELPNSITPTDYVDYSVNIPLTVKGDIIGKVTTDDGKPLFGIQVFLKGTSVSYTSTDLGGFFKFSVKPGTYFLEVEFMDYEKYTTESFNLTQEEQKEITIILSKQKGKFTYEIKAEDGKALSEVEAEILKTGSGVLVEKLTKASGTIELVPGVYTLKADAKGYNPSEINFEITKEGISKSLTLKVANGSLKVLLKNSKGNPISGVSILVDGVQKGTSDNSGTIVISDLPPKEYQVVASSTMYGKVTQIVKVEGETEKEINLVLESNIIIQALPIIIIAAFFVIVFLLKKNLKRIGLPKLEPIQQSPDKSQAQEALIQTHSQDIPPRQPSTEGRSVPIKKSKLKTRKSLKGLPKKPSKNKGNP